MTERAQSPEAIALELAHKLLLADGLGMYSKDHKDAATREQIKVAYSEAAALVNIVLRQR